MSYFQLNKYCIILCLLSGCATTQKLVDLDQITPNQNAIIAKVTVNYNGHPLTNQCHVYFNNSHIAGLDLDGTIISVVPIGVNKITGVGCKGMHKSLYGLFFNVTPKIDNSILYIGDITLNWNNDSGMSLSQQADYHGAHNRGYSHSSLGGALGTYVSNVFSDNKHIKSFSDVVFYEVHDNMQLAQERIKHYYPQNQTLYLKKALVRK
jgi:uncharacterized protein YceK